MYTLQDPKNLFVLIFLAMKSKTFAFSIRNLKSLLVKLTHFQSCRPENFQPTRMPSIVLERITGERSLGTLKTRSFIETSPRVNFPLE